MTIESPTDSTTPVLADPAPDTVHPDPETQVALTRLAEDRERKRRERAKARIKARALAAHPTHVVLRSFTAFDVVRLPGEAVAASTWRTVDSLTSNRYLAPLDPDAPKDTCQPCGRIWTNREPEGDCPGRAACGFDGDERGN